MRASRWVLLASVSALALQGGALKASAAEPAGPVWTFWGEYGGALVGGGAPFVPGFTTPPFAVGPNEWGMQGAGGTDYRFANSPWHLSDDFRSMGYGSRNGGGPETAFFPGAIVGTNSANATEGGFEADFMVGHDFGIGWQGQWKVGIRVADLYSQTQGTAAWQVTGAPSPSSQTSTYTLNERFIGAGPRAAVEGSVPLQGGWSFDYNGGIAGLVGQASATQNVAVTLTGPPFPVCASGCPLVVNNTTTAFVFNADVQAGFSYWVTPAAKLSLLYRFDGYWNALGGFNSAGNSVNLTRYYQGPTLRFTMSY